MPDLLVIVPSRGRPESVARVARAWEATGAFEDARLMFAVDADDPSVASYRHHARHLAGDVAVLDQPSWTPMVPKLNRVALTAAVGHGAIAFMGDDHLPRTPGWANRYLTELRALGTGIVYGNDGYQGERLPTQWAMTADIVRALGRMVPAPVEHLYCDNAILDLGRAAGCIRYLPDVLVEHMHPVAGKAADDDQYRRVNGRDQYRRDRAAYRQWSRSRSGLLADTAAVRALTRP